MEPETTRRSDRGRRLALPGSVLARRALPFAILFLSLISGRNPELLIGKHVIAAPYLKASKLEVIPTGYMLIDGGNRTTVAYMSNTDPIPAEKVRSQFAQHWPESC